MRYFSNLAAGALLCCQLLIGGDALSPFGVSPASASEGRCLGADGGDLAGGDKAALEDCLLTLVCIEGIYDPPRTVALSPDALAAYRAAEMDVSGRHFKLEVRFRKRAGSFSGQCDYESPRRFMFSLVELGDGNTLKVIFDADWVY